MALFKLNVSSPDYGKNATSGLATDFMELDILIQI